MNAIKAEMALFDSTGKRGSCLETSVGYSYIYWLSHQYRWKLKEHFPRREAIQAKSAKGTWCRIVRSRDFSAPILTSPAILGYRLQRHHSAYLKLQRVSHTSSRQQPQWIGQNGGDGQLRSRATRLAVLVRLQRRITVQPDLKTVTARTLLQLYGQPRCRWHWLPIEAGAEHLRAKTAAPRSGQ